MGENNHESNKKGLSNKNKGINKSEREKHEKMQQKEENKQAKAKFIEVSKDLLSFSVFN